MDVKKTIQVPNHIAIIMDGNRRWAQKRGLSRSAGHAQGSLTVQRILEHAHNLDVKYLTLYAFSSENWQRPPQEIDEVFAILEDHLKHNVDELIERGIRVLVLGQVDRLPASLKRGLDNVVHKTAQGKNRTLSLALSYGAWNEVTDAVKAIHRSPVPLEITPAQIREHLYTANLPDPDLLIRTGGELRLSNFLLLQLSYSELYFTKTLWPDFQKRDFDLALMSFNERTRRYGGD